MTDNGTGGSAPRRSPLSPERIISETLALIDEQGIAAASMRTVADRLGVRAMSLYRHIDNREDLFDAVVERIVNELSEDPDVPASAESVGWRDYLRGLAWGVRRYARAHPHAFPLVATRPPHAPWVNPPLRSLRWIEAMLETLRAADFTDDQVLFTYRTFNSFLLGYLLLETSSMVLADPKPGDGSFQTGDDSGEHDPVDPADPVPGGVSPTRRSEVREAAAEADTATDLVDVTGDVPESEYPQIHRLRRGLTEDRFEEEFGAGLEVLLDRIAAELAG
ncbi:transcriptional regulator, TetR family [Jatrophihabitans endophyticus]|uniref:Transcriptional regulator, TetR family n=1 Tax=Jatrophihabitans endophyticus TaxID=1206085 RepID=A0A1M5E1D2_9ACTN|nr:TetR/AcrR family transcriptional regulator [Jatrophihabitans endophyticus]SHF73049.1 transcriptional regulator, TetR family [Jatrophihabitans endophyticus]